MPADEGYRVIPASILERPDQPTSFAAHRLSRYFFGLALVAVLGAMGYFAFSEQLLVNEAGDDADVERLLADYQNGSSADAAAGFGQVQVQIASRPDGAIVEIDGERIGTTPLDRTLATGAYIVSLRRPDYAPLDTVVVFVEGGSAALSFALRESPGALADGDFGSVAQGAIPPGIGGTEAAGSQSGSAGATSASSPPENTAGSQAGSSGNGAATPSSGAGQTPPASDQAELPSSASETPASQMGAVTISSQPSGASVVLDGRFVGRTPMTSLPVQPGTHELSLFMDGHLTYVESIVVASGASTSIHGALSPEAGELSILVLPWGSIYIDNTLHRADTDVRYSASVPAGEHTIRAVHPTLGAITRQVTVRPNGTTSLTLDFEAQE